MKKPSIQTFLKNALYREITSLRIDNDDVLYYFDMGGYNF